MLILKQSTSIDIRMGPFMDATDAVTPETGITLAGADQAEVLKANGAATVAMAGTFAAVTGADGWYDYTCGTGDVDTVGEVVFVVQDTSVCLPVFVRGYVVEEAVYDSMYAASAAGPLQSTTAGRKLDVTATGAAGIDWGNVENPTTAVDLSATDIQLADTVTTLTGHTAQTGDSFARIGAAGAGLTDLGGMSTAMKAEVNAEADTALTDYDPPTNAEMEARTLVAASYFDPAADTVATVTSVTNEVTADVTKISGSATAADNLEASALGIISGTAQTGTLSTTVMTSDLTGFANDELIGRVVVWTGGTAAGQASDITDYASASGTVTYTAITTAPANADPFVIV